MEMSNFESKELNRVFDKIFFVDQISKTPIDASTVKAEVIKKKQEDRRRHFFPCHVICSTIRSLSIPIGSLPTWNSSVREDKITVMTVYLEFPAAATPSVHRGLQGQLRP